RRRHGDVREAPRSVRQGAVQRAHDAVDRQRHLHRREHEPRAAVGREGLHGGARDHAAENPGRNRLAAARAGGGAMKFGLHSVTLHTCAHPDPAARLGRAAENAGFESLWVADHVVLPDPPVPGRPMPPDMRLLDPLVALTFFAAHTSRIRLATGVIILPQRQAVVLAKQLASLDVLSNGRVIFGLGVGWCEPEMKATGAAFKERGRIGDDYLAAMRALWTQKQPAHRGPYVSFEGVQAMPRPVQASIPVVVGGRTAPAYRRAVTKGNGWYGFGLEV